MTEEAIQQIKDNSNIVDVFEHLTNQTLSRKGKQLTALCPFHDDTHKGNFFIYPDTNSFHCFACGSGGDVIKFVQELCNCGYIEALQIIAEISHINTDNLTSYHSSTKRVTEAKKKVIPTSFISEEYLIRTLDKDSTLKDYLCTLIDKEDIDRTFSKYRVGADKQGNTIYWYVDQQGGVRSGKIMAYGTDGHRQGKANWVHSVLLNNNLIDTFNFQSCLFGEHLLNGIPEGSEVAVVEAEKTALVCDALFSNKNIKVWLAVGGKKSDISFYEKLKPYYVHLFPDVDSVEQWQGIANKLKKEGIDIHIKKAWLKFTEGNKDDLADVLLRRLADSNLRSPIMPAETSARHVIPIRPIMYDWDICNFADNWLYQEIRDKAVNGMPF